MISHPFQRRLICVVLSGLLPACSPTPATGEQVFVKVPKPSRLQAPAANETSGLAATVSGDEGLWLVNDSGGEPVLYLVGQNGADRGRVRVETATNLDWEDLAGFSWQGKPYLLIADVGDNEARRATCTLYIVPEPARPHAGDAISGSVTPAWTIEFRYPDGPRDCESVAVDAVREKVILIQPNCTTGRIW